MEFPNSLSESDTHGSPTASACRTQDARRSDFCHDGSHYTIDAIDVDVLGFREGRCGRPSLAIGCSHRVTGLRRFPVAADS